MASNLRNPTNIDDLLLFRLSQILAKGGAPVIRLCEGQYGITRREWRVIASLQSVDRMLSSELAEHLGLDRARTSRAITSLVSKGLLFRHSVTGDQRKAALEMTGKGRELYAQLFPQVQNINSRLLTDLSEEDLVQLDKILCAIQNQSQRLDALDGLPKANRRRGQKRPSP